MGGEAHPSVMARSWYMNECRSVLVGAKWCVWARVLASESWNVAYGEMSSEVSATIIRAMINGIL